MFYTGKLTQRCTCMFLAPENNGAPKAMIPKNTGGKRLLNMKVMKLALLVFYANVFLITAMGTCIVSAALTKCFVKQTT